MNLSALKVLSMAVKPGQELDYLDFEQRGTYNWRISDGSAYKPDQVYVKGPANVLKQLLDLIADQRSAKYDYCDWYFNSRGEADKFVSIVRMFPELSYWQLGLSSRHTTVAYFPLLGYHIASGISWQDAVEEAKRHEKMRAGVDLLLRETHYDFFMRTYVSVVLMDCSNRPVADLPFGKPPEDCANYGVFPHSPKMYYILFAHESAGGACFLDYASRGGFPRVWRFGVSVR